MLRCVGCGDEFYDLPELLERHNAITVGRDPTCTIVLTHPDVESVHQISRQHANIARRPDKSFVLVDANSTNGTYVKRRHANVYHQLVAGSDWVFRTGDRVRFGIDNLDEFQFEFVALELTPRAVASDDLSDGELERPNKRVCIDCTADSPAASGETSNVADHLMCAICQDVVVGAHVLSCGHMFCGLCIAQWLRSQNKSQQACTSCPECRAEVTMPPARCIAIDKVAAELGAPTEDTRARRGAIWSLVKDGVASAWRTRFTGSPMREGLPGVSAA